MQVLFPLYCVALAAWGIKADRITWRIVALFSMLHLILETYVWPASVWVMPCVGAIECLTVACLTNYANTRTSKALAVLFGFLSFWHCWFYVDFSAGYYLIYDSYNQAIMLTTVAMMTLGTNGILQLLTTLGDRLGDRLPNPSSILLPNSNGIRLCGKGSQPKRGINHD